MEEPVREKLKKGVADDVNKYFSTAVKDLAKQLKEARRTRERRLQARQSFIDDMEKKKVALAQGMEKGIQDLGNGQTVMTAPTEKISAEIKVLDTWVAQLDKSLEDDGGKIRGIEIKVRDVLSLPLVEVRQKYEDSLGEKISEVRLLSDAFVDAVEGIYRELGLEIRLGQVEQIRPKIQKYFGSLIARRPGPEVL